MGMLTAALRRYRCLGPFDYLKERLLDSLARNITGDRDILSLPGYLVYLINIDYSKLCPLDIIIGSLYKLEQNVLNILAHITCLRERCRIRYTEWNVDYLGQGLSQQCLSRARRAEHYDIALLELDIIVFLCRHPLVVIVNGYGQYLLGFFLPYNILIQEILYFPGL